MESHDSIPRRAIGADPSPPSARKRATDTRRPSTAAEPSVATPAHSARPPKRLKRSSASKTVYFRDEAQLAELEKLAKEYPRCTVSAIIQQLVAGVLISNVDKDRRTIDVQLKLYL